MIHVTVAVLLCESLFVIGKLLLLHCVTLGITGLWKYYRNGIR